MRVLALVIRLGGGGAEASVSRMVEPLAQRGIELTRLACLPAQPGEESDPAQTIAPHTKLALIGPLLSAWKLRTIVLRDKTEILHIHCERPELLLSLSFPLRFPRRLSVVVTEHTRKPWNAHPHLGRIIRSSLSLKGARFVSCFDSKGIETIYNPTSGSSRSFENPSRLKRILIIGRLNPGKRVEWILRAAALANCTLPIVVIGDGPSRGELEALTKELGIDVRFLGFRSTPWDHGRTGDLFVSASAFEGEPLTLVEAIGAGLPTLVSDIPGHTELTQNSSQRFRTVEDLRQRLVRVLDPAFFINLMPSQDFRTKILADRNATHVASQWARLYESLAGHE